MWANRLTRIDSPFNSFILGNGQNIWEEVADLRIDETSRNSFTEDMENELLRGNSSSSSSSSLEVINIIQNEDSENEEGADTTSPGRCGPYILLKNQPNVFAWTNTQEAPFPWTQEEHEQKENLRTSSEEKEIT